nr:MAG TPA: hypothetical protein [Caudoviricetes sp.]
MMFISYTILFISSINHSLPRKIFGGNIFY